MLKEEYDEEREYRLRVGQAFYIAIVIAGLVLFLGGIATLFTK